MFVRIDRKGDPVYGSLILRPVKPRNGRFIQVYFKNPCCRPVPIVATIDPGSFAAAATGIKFSISNEDGTLSVIDQLKHEGFESTFLALVEKIKGLNQGFGEMTSNAVIGEIVFNNPPYEDVEIKTEYY